MRIIFTLSSSLILAALLPAADQDELSRQATDPTASLMALNFQLLQTADFHGAPVLGEEDHQSAFQFRPVVPWQAFGRPNILRATVPYQINGRGDEGFGSVSVFDLVVFDEDWGRWGLGPLISVDTTGDLPDPFAAGPAVGFVWQATPKLNMGLFAQNVFWEDTAVSQIQPVIAYQLGHGWSLSAGDLQFAYDWEAARWISLPVGFQNGKVTKLGSQPIRLALNPQYNLQNDRGLPAWSVTFTFTALFPAR